MQAYRTTTERPSGTSAIENGIDCCFLSGPPVHLAVCPCYRLPPEQGDKDGWVQEAGIPYYIGSVPLCGTFHSSFDETILPMSDGGSLIGGLYIDR